MFFNTLVDNLLATLKVPKFSYSTSIEKSCPDKRISFWNCFADDTDDPDWTEFIIINVPLILVFGHFISKFFITQLLSMIFCLKSREKTLQIVVFVKSILKL